MKDKAIAKITAEAMAIDDPLAFAIEEYLTDRCTTNAAAEKLLAENKTLKQIYDKIWSEARKRRKGQVAFIPPEEVFRMIDEYYGLNQKAAPTKAAADRVNVLDLF